MVVVEIQIYLRERSFARGSGVWENGHDFCLGTVYDLRCVY